MSKQVQIRRGLNASIPTLAEGEYWFSTDLNQMFVGSTSNGNVPLVTASKKYKALLTQTGTNAPTASILENTLGGTPTYSYVSSGYFTCTATGLLTTAKTIVRISAIAMSDAEINGFCGIDNVDYTLPNSFNISTVNFSNVGTNGMLNGLVLLDIEVFF